MPAPIGRRGSGADVEVCDDCATRITNFVALPGDCEAVDFRAIPLSCPKCWPAMLAQVRITAARQKNARRTPEEAQAALADFKRKGRN